MPQSFEEAFPDGFEGCVRTLGREPSVDDPEAVCRWLQEHGFEAIREESPDSILAGLSVEFVSVVDEPAQDSEWLLAKSATADATAWTPGKNRLSTADVLLKAGPDTDGDDPERKVWAAVLKPGEADAHGDLVPNPEIERSAHEWMKQSRKMDSDHDLLDVRRRVENQSGRPPLRGTGKGPLRSGGAGETPAVGLTYARHHQ